MSSKRVRLGELLVAAQIITREQLADALEHQKRDGRRLGKLLLEGGLVTETQVTQILSQQLSVPWVSLYHIDFSRQLLDLVPRELAEKYGLVPIFVRRVRGLGETLYVAMDDPSDEPAQRELSQYCGLPVRAMIAPPSDIRSAIRVYYGGGADAVSLSEAVAEVEADEARRRAVATTVREVPAPRDARAPAPRAEPPPPRRPEPSRPEASRPEPSRPEATGAMAPAAPPAAAPFAAATPAEHAIALDHEPQIEAREVSMPAPARGKASRMVTLTLLDGTKVNLPARAKPKVPSEPAPHAAPPAELTARDLAAALRAVSHGADASEILGDSVRWEALFAALLSLLLQKQLIADWEFVEEYRKI